MVPGLLDPRSKDSGTDAGVPGRPPLFFTGSFLERGSLGIIQRYIYIDIQQSNSNYLPYAYSIACQSIALDEKPLMQRI